MEKRVEVIHSDIMSPTLRPGDELACIEDNMENPLFGGGMLYFVELTNGLTAIRRVTNAGDSIILKDEKYGGKQTIQKAKISKIFRVVASLRRF